MMDKKRSVLNVGVSLGSHLVLLITAIIVRRLLIRYIGNDVNGLNSLYASILGTLGVIELGVGRAIVYSMYKPIIAEDGRTVAALFRLYQRLYTVIGLVIFCLGLLVIPFLPKLINDYGQIRVDVYVTFLITLISVVLSYLYSAKTALIEAHKDNYITTVILTISSFVRYGLQAVAILFWKSYVAFLFCQIIGTLTAWILTETIVNKQYHEVVSAREALDDQLSAAIIRNVKAMVMHKLGTVLVNGADSLIISAFIGVVILGKYSNYIYIVTAMTGVINLFFNPLTSVVGHLCASGKPEEIRSYYNRFYALNYILGVVFFLGYYAVIDNVITLLFGEGLAVSRAIAFIITLSQFISYMRNASLLFRNASGTFYNDRWKPVVEGVVNLVLSLSFVMAFPEEYKVVGVIIATIITTLLICDTVEPYVIFKHVFKAGPGRFYIRNYAYIGLFVAALFVMTRIPQMGTDLISGILENGLISVGVSVLVLLIVVILDGEFRDDMKSILRFK